MSEFDERDYKFLLPLQTQSAAEFQENSTNFQKVFPGGTRLWQQNGLSSQKYGKTLSWSFHLPQQQTHSVHQSSFRTISPYK